MSIKPFYVYKPTREETIEIVDRAMTNGAGACHCVEGGEKYYNACSFSYNHDDSWGVDDEGEPEMHTAFTVMGTIVMVSFSGSLLSLEWLKIWIAPKVWLVDYAATLIK